MPTSSSASRTAVASSNSPSSTAPPGNAICPLCAARLSERREKRMDQPPSTRTSGTSTQARRYCGAWISIAARRSRIFRRRSSDSSVNRDTPPRLRLDERNTLHAIHQLEPHAAQIGRKLEGRPLARCEIARQIQPEAIRDQAITGLTVLASPQCSLADVADGQRRFGSLHDFEFWEERECSGDADSRGRL